MTDDADPAAHEPSDALDALGPLLPVADAPPAGTARLSLRARAVAIASAYLPLVLLALLALGTWWLVKSTPVDETARPTLPPRHDPDYTMRGFTVQRFSAAGPLRAQIDGDVLRHFPDTDRIEIDAPRIRSLGLDGRVTRASARRAISNGDGSEVQLYGDAQVTREATATEPPMQFRGEFLHAFMNTEQVRTHLPATLTRGDTELRGDTMRYDNVARTVELKGRVHATFAAPSRAAAR